MILGRRISAETGQIGGSRVSGLILCKLMIKPVGKSNFTNNHPRADEVADYPANDQTEYHLNTPSLMTPKLL